MAAIAWTDVTELAAALTDLSVPAQTMILDSVNASVEVANFDGEDGPDTKLVRVFKAAHIGTLALLAQTGAAGPVTSESAGKLARSYAGVDASAGEWGLTIWGRLYQGKVLAAGSNRGGFVV